ncbi:Amino-acid permease [Podosphaera aphanis]|nr:Amino-acid permease [Podosphaera aphanis]
MHTVATDLDDKQPSQVLQNDSNQSPSFKSHSPVAMEKNEPTGRLNRLFWSFTRDTPLEKGSIYSNGDACQLQQDLKRRHVSMIAMSGCIGTGLFVASGKALQVGGPASLLIAFMFVGYMLNMTMYSLGEMTAMYPVAGSFATYSTRFIDPAWGFAMGWNYAIQWLITLPLELIAASVTINFWDDNKYNHAIFVAVFLVFIIMINMFGVKSFGETEFILGLVKVSAVVGFIILGIISSSGGVPGYSYIGAKYWQDPGPFNNGFKGICSIFVFAACSFTGTELVGLTAAECQNPSKELPKAIKQVFWRVIVFYAIPLALIGMLVPYNDARLLSHGDATAATSPFVISIQNAGISVLPSIMNAVIFLAIISVGNSAVYGASRTLASLADQGQAPKIIGYVDRKGRPLVGILISAVFGLLGFMVNMKSEATVLDWLMSTSGLSSIFTWGSICLAHMRFRKAWRKQGNSLEDLVFQSPYGIWGTIIAFVLNFLLVAAQLWTAVWPVDQSDMSHVAAFFKSFLCAPMLLILYFSYKAINKTRIARPESMDLDTGRRYDVDPRKLRNQVRIEWEAMSVPKKIISCFC